MEIKYQQVPLTKENINTLEYLRYNAFNFSTNDFPPQQTFHYKQLSKQKYLVYGCYINNNLTGACYISNSHNSLYIEQLFINKKFQKNKLHLGKNLLLFILTNKKTIEQHFHTKFHYSNLDSTENTKNFYTALGYKEKNYLLTKHL